MVLTKNEEIINKITDMAGLRKGSEVLSIYQSMSALDTFKLGLIYDYLCDAPKEKRRKFLLKLIRVCFNTRDKKLYPEELRELFGWCLSDCIAENSTETDEIEAIAKDLNTLRLSETNGVDIRGCQCFTCKHKNDKEALEGYYTGAYEAYKEAIELVREAFPDDNSADWLKIKSLLSKLGYEKDCSGALLEEASLGKERKMVNVFTIDGTIQTSANYNEDKVSDKFIRFMEENGFSFGGRIKFFETIPEPEKDEE